MLAPGREENKDICIKLQKWPEKLIHMDGMLVSVSLLFGGHMRNILMYVTYRL